MASVDTTTTRAPVPVPAPLRLVPRPGSRVVSLLHEAGELTAFCARALAAIPGSVRYMSEALRHAAAIIRSTSTLTFVMNMFLGISVVNFGFFFLRSIGASDYTGLASGYVDIRQCANVMFGYVFAAKVCCGITAELGSMRINQEIKAYESTGVDPMRYVVGTRMIAVLIFIPIGGVLALLGSTAGSYLAAVVVLRGLSSQGFLDVHWSVQSISDQLFTMIAIGFIGVFCALVACFYGLRTRGGPDAVGASAARSLIVNLVLVHLIGVFFAVLFYGTNIRLPIGG
jgi:phospholipid/cholesterol/gamma-HCH transport system permease protein